METCTCWSSLWGSRGSTALALFQIYSYRCPRLINLRRIGEMVSSIANNFLTCSNLTGQQLKLQWTIYQLVHDVIVVRGRPCVGLWHLWSGAMQKKVCVMWLHHCNTNRCCLGHLKKCCECFQFQGLSITPSEDDGVQVMVVKYLRAAEELSSISRKASQRESKRTYCICRYKRDSGVTAPRWSRPNWERNILLMGV